MDPLNGARHPRQISRKTAGELVADLLRTMIIGRELAPGASLRETALAEEFGVSRQTVQDALGVLANERLVKHERHRGSRVTSLTRDDVRDLYRVRQTLELAVAEGVATVSDAGLAGLQAAFERLSQASEASDAMAIVRSDLQFHRAVVALMGSERFNRFFSAISSEMGFAISMLESATNETMQRPKEALEEHRAIMDALLARDSGLAKRLVNEHIEVNRENLLRGASFTRRRLT